MRVLWQAGRRWRPDPLPLLTRAARHVLRAERRRVGQVVLAVVDARAMRDLHQRYRGSREVTDVLTFDYAPSRRSPAVHGDLAICADVARQQARARAIDPRRELTLYAVHGLLHLCGYDDRTAAGFRRMHAREDELLSQLGLGAVFGAAARRVENRPRRKVKKKPGRGGRPLAPEDA